MVKQRIQLLLISFLFITFLFLLLPQTSTLADSSETSLIWVHLTAGDTSSIQIRLNGDYSINDYLVHDGTLTLQTVPDGITVNHSSEGALGTHNQVKLIQENSSDWNSYLSLNNNLYGYCNYLGNLTVSKKDAYSFDIVNRIPINEYIFGIICNILPDNASEESVKSLAVAARSLVLSNLGGNGNYDFEDYEMNLEYSGYNPSYDTLIDTFESVKDQVLYYNNKIIACYHCYSNGGYGVKPDDRWTAATDEISTYLPTYDPYDLEFSSDTIYFSLPEDLSQASADTIEFLKHFLSSETTVKSIIKILTLETFHKDLDGLIFESETTMPAWIRATILCSTDSNDIEVEIEFPLEALVQDNVVQAPSANTCFLLHHGQNGWIFVFSRSEGHRVGLSCCGMQRLAELGYTYQEILSFYFPGSSMKTYAIH